MSPEISAPAVSLVRLAEAPDAVGEPRVGLLVRPGLNRRPLLTVFPTLAAALAAKRSLEARQ
ncbi:MAG TPA: hypothetical protein VNZ61_02390 [Roseomonas sp.]|nr:hypothetical protein [Roseomonas sp.]